MTALVIANTQIRRDGAGRFCLNDLHQASGGAKRHQPANWLRSEQALQLVAELNKDESPVLESQQRGHQGVAYGDGPFLKSEERVQPVSVTQGGFAQGTYAVKELVYAYAMWISAAFHLHVIRAYDALVTAGAAAEPPPVPLSATHRADVLVSATRTFAALVRAGRTLRMGHARALTAANDATLRATGIDLIDELGAHDLAAAPALPDAIPPGLPEWLHDRHHTTTRDVIVGLNLGDPHNVALQMRTANALRTLGWQKVRTAGQWGWQRTALTTAASRNRNAS